MVYAQGYMRFDSAEAYLGPQDSACGSMVFPDHFVSHVCALRAQTCETLRHVSIELYSSVGATGYPHPEGTRPSKPPEIVQQKPQILNHALNKEYCGSRARSGLPRAKS